VGVPDDQFHQDILAATQVGIGLAEFAHQLHLAGIESDVYAQNHRTVAVAIGWRYGTGLIVVASSLGSLNSQQKGVLADLTTRLMNNGRLGSVDNASNFSAGHAETKIVGYALKEGIGLGVMGVSRPICYSCSSLIFETGGILLTSQIAAWP
jgi:hypothetical protein